MKSRAVFLDRDGTINKDSGYVNKPGDVRLLKHSAAGLVNIQKLGLLSIVVSNQSGVGRGYLTKDMLDKITTRLEELLDKEMVTLTDIYYAPFFKNAVDAEYRKNEEERKPNTGMIQQAAKKYDIDISTSYLIGDMETDIMLGNNAGLKTILVLTGSGRETMRSLNKNNKYKVEYIAKDLLDASNWIGIEEKRVAGVRRKIKNILEIKQALRLRAGQKIVFTNGCFDILHRGHIEYLQEAKKSGDILIIGLNSDKSISRIKGDGRPIFDEESRAFKLSALEFVDFVTIFEEDTPINIITELKPDILVKGGDYSVDGIVGSAEVISGGGIVRVIPFFGDYSTTNIIKKIKNQDEFNEK